MAFITLLLYIIAIYIRPQDWVPIFYALPLIDILTLAAVFFFMWESLQTKRFLFKTPQILLLFGFLAAIVLSHLSHTYFWGAVNSFTEFSKIVISFIIFVNIVNSERRIKISLWFIILLTVILAIQGIYQFQNGLGWANQPLTKHGRITWIGIFNDANDLALAIVMAIGFLLAFLFGRSNIFTKSVSLLLLSILCYGLYLTNSRGGYLALAGTILFYFITSTKKKFITVPFAACLVILAFVFGPSRLSEISAAEGSAYGRIQSWYEGVQMLKHNPLFGVGYRMFMEDYNLTAHNSYVLVSAEEGLVGLALWVAVIYSCFKGLYILRLKKPQFNTYVSGIGASLAGFLGAAFFLSRAYQVILYIMLALASSCIYTFLKEEDYAFTFKDMRIAGLLGVAILFIAWITMRVSLGMAG